MRLLTGYGPHPGKPGCAYVPAIVLILQLQGPARRLAERFLQGIYGNFVIATWAYLFRAERSSAAQDRPRDLRVVGLWNSKIRLSSALIAAMILCSQPANNCSSTTNSSRMSLS